MASLKRFLVGSPMRTEQAIHERLNKKTALAVFSSDALSSVAYSTEAILLVLLAAGTVAIGYLPLIAIGITFLLGILVLSYRQTIHAYPRHTARVGCGGVTTGRLHPDSSRFRFRRRGRNHFRGAGNTVRFPS